MITLAILFTLFFQSSEAKPTHEDKGILNIDASKYERINVYNFDGNVNVKPSSNKEASFRYSRKITASTNRKLTRAKEEIYVDTISMDGELFVFISNPEKVLRSNGSGSRFMTYHHKTDNNFNSIKASGIDYEFEFDISLPVDTDGIISTHDGDIVVKGIKGQLSVLNHHGEVKLDQVHQVDLVKSHHGELKVVFSDQPDMDVSLSTHHGNISVSFPETPSLRLDLDSYHGSFFTDFDWEPMVNKIQKTNKKKTKYKIGSATNVKIGGGKYEMSFKSHHGDMFILKH